MNSTGLLSILFKKIVKGRFGRGRFIPGIFLAFCSLPEFLIQGKPVAEIGSVPIVRFPGAAISAALSASIRATMAAVSA